MIDRTLLERYPGDTLPQLIERHRNNEAGHAIANIRAGYWDPPPTFDAFQRYITVLHNLIFRNGEPEIAGRFRRPSESVSFGRERREFYGAPPSEIERGVGLAWSMLGSPDWATRDKLAVADACACFLEAFFMVHPFVDGNGRVARIIVKMVVRASGRWLFQPPDRGADRRAYVRVLEYAHIHNPINQHKEHKPANARHYHKLLSQWLLKNFVDAEVQEQDERQPD